MSKQPTCRKSFRLAGALLSATLLIASSLYLPTPVHAANGYNGFDAGMQAAVFHMPAKVNGRYSAGLEPAGLMEDSTAALSAPEPQDEHMIPASYQANAQANLQNNTANDRLQGYVSQQSASTDQITARQQARTSFRIAVVPFDYKIDRNDELLNTAYGPAQCKFSGMYNQCSASYTTYGH